MGYVMKTQWARRTDLSKGFTNMYTKRIEDHTGAYFKSLHSRRPYKIVLETFATGIPRIRHPPPYNFSTPPTGFCFQPVHVRSTLRVDAETVCF